MTIDAAFTQFPVLTTDRFILRQLQLTDVESFFEIYSDEEVMKFYGSFAHKSIEDTQALLARTLEHYGRRESLHWGITFKGDDRAIGFCSFHHFGANHRRAETGYALNRAYWGQGIVPEALAAVVDCGFNELGLQRVEAIIDDENGRSKGVLLKLGFTYEGCLRKRYLLGDELVDEYYYGLLRDEWHGKR